jgi:hypothetical protein
MEDRLPGLSALSMLSTIVAQVLAPSLQIMVPVLPTPEKGTASAQGHECGMLPMVCALYPSSGT